MITIHSDDHRLRASKTELYGGQLVPPFEKPERVDIILAALDDAGETDIREPQDHGLDIARRIHDPDYVEFLSTVWDEWKTAGFEGEAMAEAWPARRMSQRKPECVEGRLGYYALAAETAIDAGTWSAAQASANVALTAASLVAGGESRAFALCRPPGHHAAVDLYGGYCFLNNAALAAQLLRDRGADRVAILDVDFHHGNGTQDILYERGDIFFASLHGDPLHAFPYFLGHADETGAGEGDGTTLNLPLPRKTEWSAYAEALDTALSAIRAFGPDAIVVSFGADTFKEDPISFFRLDTPDFTRMGARIAALGLPTLTVMEGGYAVDALGRNTVHFLEGLSG